MDDETLRITTELARRVTLLEADRPIVAANSLQNRADISSVVKDVKAIKEDIGEIKEGQKDARRDLRNAALAVVGSIVSGGLLYALVAVATN